MVSEPRKASFFCEKQAPGLGMAPQSWHPRNCSHRFTWAQGFKPMARKAPAHTLLPKSERAVGNAARVGAEGARGWRPGSRRARSVHPPRHHPPVGVSRSPPALASGPAQNYLLLPRRPQAKSEEVHSLWRRSERLEHELQPKLP